jgi:hypothetical protein
MFFYERKKLFISRLNLDMNLIKSEKGDAENLQLRFSQENTYNATGEAL